MLRALEPMLRDLNAEIDHRTPAHLGALLKQGAKASACSCLPMCSPNPRARRWNWC